MVNYIIVQHVFFMDDDKILYTVINNKCSCSENILNDMEIKISFIENRFNI